jgi:hypothetical protein
VILLHFYDISNICFGIYSYLICFLIKLCCKTYSTWYVSYSSIDGWMLDRWSVYMCMRMYICPSCNPNTKQQRTLCTEEKDVIKQLERGDTHRYTYTGCPRRNVKYFRGVFLMLNCTDITQNTHIQSWMVTEIMTIEKCGLLGSRRTAAVRDAILVHCPCRQRD